MSNHTRIEYPSSRRSVREAFTMIEMLVVMSVITLLLVIGVPTVIRMRTEAKLKSTRVTINIINEGIKQYHKLHKAYPSIGAMPAELIGQTFEPDPSNAGQLREVDDGHDGPGYRIQDKGQIHGPHNGVDKLTTSGKYVVGDGSDNDRVYFYDSFGRSIWYCPYSKGDDQGNTGGYVDNDFDVTSVESPSLRLSSIDMYAKKRSGGYYRKDWILMSQGADGKWGLFSDEGKTAPPTDDVTNFKE